MTAPILYTPNFFSATANGLFEGLKELAWVRRDNAPRMEYYCNDIPASYTYSKGRGQRTYEPQPWGIVKFIRDVVQDACKTKFEVCFLNRYLNQRDQLGWHADDSPEMDDTRPIAILSFGAEREIWFRPVLGFQKFGEPEKWKLGHGSLCLMQPGMQDRWQHRIPKASFACGERISLTFRGYVKP
jgi:alkylated DNA repair dioxygenase AlkB